MVFQVVGGGGQVDIGGPSALQITVASDPATGLANRLHFDLVYNYFRMGPIYTPPSPAAAPDSTRGTLSLPSTTGGANWEGGALDHKASIDERAGRIDGDIVGTESGIALCRLQRDARRGVRVEIDIEAWAKKRIRREVLKDADIMRTAREGEGGTRSYFPAARRMDEVARPHFIADQFDEFAILNLNMA